MSDFLEKKTMTIANKGGQANRQRFQAMKRQALAGAEQSGMMPTSENDMSSIEATLGYRSRLASLETEMIENQANRAMGAVEIQGAMRQDSIQNSMAMQEHSLEEAQKGDWTDTVGKVLTAGLATHGLAMGLRNAGIKRDADGNVIMDKNGNPEVSGALGAIGEGILSVMNRFPGLGYRDAQMIEGFKKENLMRSKMDEVAGDTKKMVEDQGKRIEELTRQTEELISAYGTGKQAINSSAGYLARNAQNHSPELAGYMTAHNQIMNRAFEALGRYHSGGYR